MTFDELTEFKKDLKNLLKKYRTLNDDLDVILDDVTASEDNTFNINGKLTVNANVTANENLNLVQKTADQAISQSNTTNNKK